IFIRFCFGCFVFIHKRPFFVHPAAPSLCLCHETPATLTEPSLSEPDPNRPQPCCEQQDFCFLLNKLPNCCCAFRHECGPCPRSKRCHLHQHSRSTFEPGPA